MLCHLRYGAEASRSMTEETMAARPTSFYPEGRSQQRPRTLEPRPGENAGDILRSLTEACASLDRTWDELDDDAWTMTVVEPADNVDLGPISLWSLALFRLTEVEVHGSDLDIGLADWSDTFVAAALPTRLKMLETRRSNHGTVDESVSGTWAFNIDGRTSYTIAAVGSDVTVAHGDAHADTTFAGTGHQILGFLLGRTALDELEVRGNHELAARWRTAFPPP